MILVYLVLSIFFFHRVLIICFPSQSVTKKSVSYLNANCVHESDEENKKVHDNLGTTRPIMKRRKYI